MPADAGPSATWPSFQPSQEGSLPERLLERPWKEVRRETLALFERQYLTELLRLTGGRVGETARRAGMEPRSLHEKMKKHGLRKEDFRREGT